MFSIPPQPLSTLISASLPGYILPLEFRTNFLSWGRAFLVALAGWDDPTLHAHPVFPSSPVRPLSLHLPLSVGNLGAWGCFFSISPGPDSQMPSLNTCWWNEWISFQLWNYLFVLMYAWFPKTDIKYTLLFLLQKGNQYNPLHWYRNLYWAKHFSHLLPSTLLPSGLSTLKFQNNLRPLLDPKRSSFWTTGTIFLSWTDLLARTAIFSPTPDGLFAKLWGLIDSQVTKQSRSAGHPDLRSLLSWPDF